MVYIQVVTLNAKVDMLTADLQENRITRQSCGAATLFPEPDGAGTLAKNEPITKTSVSDSDPHSIRIRLPSWILIRIRNADQDPRGVKSAKTEGKTELKDRKSIIKS
jgi:hypothetical protein